MALVSWSRVDGTNAFLELDEKFFFEDVAFESQELRRQVRRHRGSIGGRSSSDQGAVARSEQSAGLPANEASTGIAERGHWLVEQAHRDPRCSLCGSCAATRIREADLAAPVVFGVESAQRAQGAQALGARRHRNGLGPSSGGISSRARRVVLLARGARVRPLDR